MGKGKKERKKREREKKERNKREEKDLRKRESVSRERVKMEEKVGDNVRHAARHQMRTLFYRFFCCQILIENFVLILLNVGRRYMQVRC